MATRYINNWITKLTDVLLAGDASLPVSPEMLERLDLGGGGQYFLTLTEKIDPLAGGAHEIVMLSAGGLARGQEGTEAQDWPEDTVIYAAVTAGILGALATPSGNVVEPVHFGVGAPGNYSVPSNVGLLLIIANAPGTFEMVLTPPSNGVHQFHFEIRSTGGHASVIDIKVDGFGVAAVYGIDGSIVGGSWGIDGSTYRITNLSGVLRGVATLNSFASGRLVVAQQGSN